MRGRRYGVYSRGRSPSPRRPPPRSRDFSPTRRRKYSPYNSRRTEEHSREGGTSRRIEKRGQFDRGFNLRAPRLSEYDNRDRDRDRHVLSGRRSSSPVRIEKRDNFDRDISKRTVRLSDYEDGGKGKYKDGVNVGRSRTSFDDEAYRGDSSGTKFRWDHLLDGPRKSDHLNVKDYSHTRDYKGDGYTNITSGGGERNYSSQSSYSDSGRGGLLSASQYLGSTKPVSLEYESGGRMHPPSYTLARDEVDTIPISNLSGGDGSRHMPSVASRYSNTDTERKGYFHSRDELSLEKRDRGLRDQDHYFEKKSGGFHFRDGFLGMERTVGREIYKFEKKDNLLSSRDYLKGDSNYMVSSSQPKDYVPVSSGILREGFPGYSATAELQMPSDVIRPRSGLDSQPIGLDGYSERKQNILPRGPGYQLDDTRSRSRLYVGLADKKQGDQLYAEFDRSKIDSVSTRHNDVEEYRHQHMSRSDVLHPTVDESPHKKYTRDDGPRDQYPFSQVQSAPDKFDASGSLHARNQDLNMLGIGSSHFNLGTNGYSGYRSVKPVEQHAEMDGGPGSHLESSDILQSRGPLSLYNSPRKRLASADLSFVEPAERRLRHKHERDEILHEHDVGIRISTNENGARKIYNQVDVRDENDLGNLSKKPKSSKSKYEKMWRPSSDMANDQPSSSKFDPRHPIKPRKSDSRDIKKRLGPVPQKLHVSQRLVKKYKPSIKKRLAPAPPKRRATLPWLKNLSSKRMASIQDGSDGSPHNHDGDQLGDHLPLAKPEPPEKSEEFKQLVQSAFFKFLKQINETETKRKKYTENGKAGSMKCIACGSNSDDFVETESLAMHAFTSRKVGLRSQHLGLHKALCVLMGWKITEDPSSEWHCEAMSNAETSALKEDLIIWPPLVIVHNSTVDNENPDERVIVSTEKLDMNLRDMGFGSILKVCNGKPANQSVMLVKFNGTLSGLQEAERFHKSYLESKHGRAELTQLKCGGAPVISPEIEENFLYGHLGIAEDLDNLDFDTKKRCVLRSKKEILSIADASLGTEGDNGCY